VSTKEVKMTIPLIKSHQIIKCVFTFKHASCDSSHLTHCNIDTFIMSITHSHQQFIARYHHLAGHLGAWKKSLPPFIFSTPPKGNHGKK
jgi:hypothetical protein